MYRALIIEQHQLCYIVIAEVMKWIKGIYSSAIVQCISAMHLYNAKKKPNTNNMVSHERQLDLPGGRFSLLATLVEDGA